jgi:hypothetical protein
VKVQGIVLHHAASTMTGEQIEAAHRANGWGVTLPSGVRVSTGYHYVVEQDGTLRMTGRPESKTGAHARGSNSTHLGVCMAVDGREGLPEPCRWQTIRLLADLCRRHALEASAIVPHRGVGSTVCPGITDEDFDQLVADVEDLI